MTKDKKKTNKRLLKTAKVSANSGAAARFAAAMLNPFDRAAFGAQIPDTYCAPTATYHIKNRFTLTSASDGTADLVIVPNACVHAYCFNGAASGGVTLITRDGTSYANAGAYTPASTLSGKLANYRIVAMGVRIKCITSMTDGKGSMVAAVLPVESITPCGGPNLTVGGVTAATDAAQTIAAWYAQNGIPYTGTGSTAVLDAGGLDNLPVSTSMSVLQLSERPVEVRPKPTTAYWTMFRRTTDGTFGFDTVNQSSPVDCGDGGYLRIGGLETVAIKFHGCAASTAIAEFEVMYHLEGSPSITGGATTQIAPGGSCGWVDTRQLDRVLNTVSQTASFFESATGAVLSAMSAARGTYNAVSGAAGRVAGYLGY